MRALPPILSSAYIRFFFRNRHFFFWNLCAVIIHLFVWGLIALNFGVLYQSERDFIALHYTVFKGIDLYTNWHYVFTLPFLGLVVIGANYMLSRRIYYLENFGALLLSFAACVFQVILFFALQSVIHSNIF